MRGAQAWEEEEKRAAFTNCYQQLCRRSVAAARMGELPRARKNKRIFRKKLFFLSRQIPT